MTQVCPIESLTGILRDAHSVAAAILFGSAVTGNLRDDSDVDIAILLTEADAGDVLDPSYLELLGTLGQSARRDVHLIELKQVDIALRREIFVSGSTLFDRSGGRLDSLKTRTFIEYVDCAHLRQIIDTGHRQYLERFRGQL